MTEYISCDCKCKFNSATCQCECKNYCKCKEDYSLNLAHAFLRIASIEKYT